MPGTHLQSIMHKFKKTLLITLISIILTVIAIILFISPITKYLIEKYDEHYTGRKITMDWAYVNPFTGYIHFSGLKIYESQSDTLFISMNSLSSNFEVLKLLSKTIEIKDFTLNKPHIVISQKNLHFNFDDLITKFSSPGPVDTLKEIIHVSLQNVKIKNGHFYYVDYGIPVHFSIKKIYVESKEGWSWDKDVIAAKFSFLSEIGTGGMKGNYSMNLKTLNYKMGVKVTHFDMKVIEQYMKDFTNFGTFRANLDADFKAKGCFKDAQDISAKGELAISDFHFGKNPTEDYLSFDKVVVNLKEVNPKLKRYFIDSMSLIHPYFKYEQYDNSNNLETMFGNNGANATVANSNPTKFNIIFVIGRYVEQLATNFLKSNYKINKLGIYKCNLQYNDYSLPEQFSIALNPLEIRADSVYKSKDRVHLRFSTGIKPYGNASIRISINPKDSSDFDMQYNIQKMPVAIFNPYIVSYTSFPIDRGTIVINGLWHVKNGNIQSTNHLIVIDPRVTKRINKKGLKWLPMNLIMAFVRERGNVIDYEIPITGNLNNPKFHWRDVIRDILKNIFIKPATIPYRTKIKDIETEIEKSLTLKWDMGSNTIKLKQERFIKKMADFLSKNPEASITIYPQNYSLKEKEHLLFFEAKKKYYLAINTKREAALNETDAQIIHKMSIKDSLFVRYLNKHINTALAFTIQEKCSRFINPALVNSRYKQLNQERADCFMAYFKAMHVESQIHFAPSLNTVPYNGFSFYKIDYKGVFPNALLKAYHQMDKLDDGKPRKEFKMERKKNRKSLFKNAIIKEES